MKIEKNITAIEATAAINYIALLLEADKHSEEKLSKDLEESFNTAICCINYVLKNVLNENDIYSSLELEATGN